MIFFQIDNDEGDLEGPKGIGNCLTSMFFIKS